MKTLITIFTIVAATIAAQALTLKLKLLDCPGGIHLSGPLHPWGGTEIDTPFLQVSNLAPVYYTNGESYFIIPRETNICQIDIRFPNVCVWHGAQYPNGWTNAYIWDNASPTPHTNWLTIKSNFVGGRWNVQAAGGTFTVTNKVDIGVNTSVEMLPPNRAFLTYEHLAVHPNVVNIDSDPGSLLIVYWQTNVNNSPFTSNANTTVVLDRQGHGTRGVADNSAIPGAFYHPTLTWTNKYPNQ